MTIILAIDTSTEACSCALTINGEVFEHFEVLPRQHANRLLPMIKALMKEHCLSYSDLDAIAVGRGPGSFTGLRIAAGVAQGIAFGADLPLLAISTLEALALQAHKNSGKLNIFSCIDARISEVYWGAFSFDESEAIIAPQLQGAESLCRPELIQEQFLDSNQQWHGCGSGIAFIESMPELIQGKMSIRSADYLPHAADVAMLGSYYYGQGVKMDPAAFVPVYLRDKVTNH